MMDIDIAIGVGVGLFIVLPCIFISIIVEATLFVLVFPGTCRWCRWGMLVLAGIIGGAIGLLFSVFLSVTYPGGQEELPEWFLWLALIGAMVGAQIIGIVVGAEKYFLPGKRR